jgi:beta-glucosidase
MNRRDALKLITGGTIYGFTMPYVSRYVKDDSNLLFTKSDFGNFNWGLATAAYQIEGAWDEDGKGLSIWDIFSHKPGKIKDGSNGNISCDFYHHYKEDLVLFKSLGFDSFRFSLSWPRIIPLGTGTANQKGIDFYNKIIDTCLENNISPWITLYHWDLPQALEEKGGWINRDIVNWFENYTSVCIKAFGDRVKHWIVLNEPMAFTGLGYGTGLHAPGKKGIRNLLPAVHHAALCQAAGGRIIRDLKPDAHIGTAISCSPVVPKNEHPRNLKAARRLDALLNRLFIEPALGMGYPFKDLHFLKHIEKYMMPDDDKKLSFDFDFWGVQHYFRIFGKFSLYPPMIWAQEEKPEKKHVPLTDLNWEVYPEGMYEVLKKISQYGIKEIVVTENGASYKDIYENGEIKDLERIIFFKNYLAQVLRAKKEGINITGYFAWTFMDNFEWAEGYKPKFGIVYTDFKSQIRTLKNSAKWFQNFLFKNN